METNISNKNDEFKRLELEIVRMEKKIRWMEREKLNKESTASTLSDWISDLTEKIWAEMQRDMIGH